MPDKRASLGQKPYGPLRFFDQAGRPTGRERRFACSRLVRLAAPRTHGSRFASLAAPSFGSLRTRLSRSGRPSPARFACPRSRRFRCSLTQRLRCRSVQESRISIPRCPPQSGPLTANARKANGKPCISCKPLHGAAGAENKQDRGLSPPLTPPFLHMGVQPMYQARGGEVMKTGTGPKAGLTAPSTSDARQRGLTAPEYASRARSLYESALVGPPKSFLTRGS